MNQLPQVSVVMSVYNGAENLSETLDSVLNQQDCDFEFIVVNDGSTDATAKILDDCAKIDERLQVIHQENTGLTRALIRGCAEASGEYIARQDAGDISLPGRLQMQCSFLREHPGAVMTGCAVQFTGPQHEPLYVTSKPMLELDAGFRVLDINCLGGPPHHGATMFRNDAYRKAGGYRAAFVVAQDIDLWLRLSELGQCLGMTEVLYQARLEAGSISSRRRDEQFRSGTLALACARERQCGGNDRRLLDDYVPTITPKKAVGRFEKARFHYFIASCLNAHDPSAAKRYYRNVLKENPFHLKALFRLIAS
jgi:hypothetical protein